jgi:hypothetical protein
MKKITILFYLIIILVSQVTLAREKGLVLLSLGGKIGKYPVEMEIAHIDALKASFDGRYRYLSQSTYLSIKGEIYDGCIYIEESLDGKETGSFYLEIKQDSLVGKWVFESKCYDVLLKVNSGDYRQLIVKSFEEYSINTNTSMTGSYATGGNWINDYWFSDENPRLEIGFNGGYAVIKDLGADSIRFQVEVICGPTYHFAMAEGTAIRMGDNYIYQGEDSACVITITLSERKLRMEATASFQCGFGARAYLYHEFIKISDKAEFGDKVSLESIESFEDQKSR